MAIFYVDNFVLRGQRKPFQDSSQEQSVVRHKTAPEDGS